MTDCKLYTNFAYVFNKTMFNKLKFYSMKTTSTSKFDFTKLNDYAFHYLMTLNIKIEKLIYETK